MKLSKFEKLLLKEVLVNRIYLEHIMHKGLTDKETGVAVVKMAKETTEKIDAYFKVFKLR